MSANFDAFMAATHARLSQIESEIVNTDRPDGMSRGLYLPGGICEDSIIAGYDVLGNIIGTHSGCPEEYEIAACIETEDRIERAEEAVFERGSFGAYRE